MHGVNAAYKSQDLLHQPGLERASTGMADQPTTCAATQVDNLFAFEEEGDTVPELLCFFYYSFPNIYFFIVQKTTPLTIYIIEWWDKVHCSRITPLQKYFCLFLNYCT